jgi:hypothetical protein
LTSTSSAAAQVTHYIEALPAFTRRLVSLPDDPRLLRELHLLERHTHVSERDTVYHGLDG